MIKYNAAPAGKPHHMQLYGMAISLLAQTNRARFSIATADAFVRPPVKLSQIVIGLCAYRGTPRAYVTFAYLSDKVLNELESSTDRALHYSEWNEGTNLFVDDVVAPTGDASAFLKFALDHVQPPHSTIHLRRRHGKRGMNRLCLR